MTTLTDLHAKGIQAYDPTMLGNFNRCHLMFKFRHELGLSNKNLKLSHSIVFGTWIHKALENWFVARDDDMAIDVFQKGFAPFVEMPKLSDKTGKELSATYTLIYGSSLLEAYFNKHRTDTRALIENEQVLAEELDDNVYLMGIVDKLLQGPRGLVFMDHKSTKYPEKYFLNPNLQFMTYKFLCEKLTGTKVSGELDILGVSKTKHPSELLRREPFDYSSFQMEWWRSSVVSTINNITRCRENDDWSQNWDCNPFGNKECQYVPLCTVTEKDALLPLMQSMYDVKFWDPFTRDED